MEPKTSCPHRNNQPKQKYTVTSTTGACAHDGRDKHAHAHAHTLYEGNNAHTHTHTHVCAKTNIQQPLPQEHMQLKLDLRGAHESTVLLSHHV